jgi:thiol:disulfide interchange protein DsbC
MMRNGYWVAAFGMFVSVGLAAQDKPDAVIGAALKTLNAEIRIDNIRPAPIAGFYEVTLSGQVVYVSGDGKYLIQGMILDIPSKLDLTEQRRSELRRGLLANAPVSQRIVFKPKGDVKHHIAVFTDIDCGYCRELHKHMTEYNDRGIQIEYLMFPRAGVGSDSYRKAVATWCAKDQQAALTGAKAGEDPGNATCINPIEAQYTLGQQMGVTGTPTLVFPDGSVSPGYVTPDQLEQRLMTMQATPAAAAKGK